MSIPFVWRAFGRYGSIMKKDDPRVKFGGSSGVAERITPLLATVGTAHCVNTNKKVAVKLEDITKISKLDALLVNMARA